MPHENEGGLAGDPIEAAVTKDSDASLSRREMLWLGATGAAALAAGAVAQEGESDARGAQNAPAAPTQQGAAAAPAVVTGTVVGLPFRAIREAKRYIGWICTGH